MKMKTKFELFPDEIILGIFEYIYIRDLYESFFDLNYRFHRLLLSRTNLSITISSPDEIEDPFFELFASNIHRLTIDHSSYIDFELFSNIRSLILQSPSDEQLEQLFICQFPNLIHLEFGIMSSNLYYRSLNDFIHCCKQYPLLATCIFHYENNAVSLNRYRQICSTNSSTLRTIWFNSIDLSFNSQSIHSIYTEKSFSMNNIHTNLKRLDICCVSLGPSIVDLDHFFQQIPNLEYLKIASNEIYYSYEFIQQLAIILRQRLHNLHEFNCELLCVLTREDLDHIPELHSCFNRIQYEIKYNGQYIRLFTQ